MVCFLFTEDFVDIFYTFIDGFVDLDFIDLFPIQNKI